MAHRKEHSIGSLKPLPRIKTNIEDPKSLSPTRSRTDPPAAAHDHEKSHLHRRLHSNSLRNRAFTAGREHGYRHAAKETVQSAMELKPPISFDTLLRRDKKTSDSHRHKENQTRQTEQQQHEVNEWTVQQAKLAEERRLLPEQIEKAKKDNVRREAELRDSLKNVEDVAMTSTRQLDDTYYAILEKASLLRSTVQSIQQLAEESRKMHSSFDDEREQLEQDTKKSLEAFGNFDVQESTINQLVEQLKVSKDRTNQLNDRLLAARNRVAAYEEREKQKRKTNRQRWGVIWAVLAAVLALVIAVMVAKNSTKVGSYPHKVAKALDNLGHEVMEIASPVAAMLVPTASQSHDSVLGRMFDEL